MNISWLKTIPIALCIGAVPAHAADLQLAGSQPTLAGVAAADGEWGKAGFSTDESGQSTYIVQLADAPLATYDGGLKGLQATSNRSTGAKKLNTNSKASKAYRKHLKKNQEAFLQSTGLAASYDYQVVFNGVAVRATKEQAEAIAAMPGVRNVFRERNEVLNTDAGPGWINADAIWDGPPFNVSHSRGEGMVIAILDSGINHDHPSFADIGGDGYDHSNPLGSGNYIPGSYCDTVDPSFCNDKLIGAWSFVTEAVTPEDSDGHGSHTASTAAGNVIPAATVFAPTTSVTRPLSGVAPHANIIAYDVCIDSCPTSALLAAINQVVIDAAALPDGIHALNYSISGGTDPYNDPIELGFLNATEAGVYVSASAGNSGPGAGTLGHQPPWLATTAASTHNRAFPNSLVGMSSDGAPLDDIVSVGFTAAYGPAQIVYAGDYPTSNGSSNDVQPEQCLDPFPAGHFNGEIVLCDRGSIARVAKGANVLAGGAGGMILANTAAQGEGVVGDPHFLPAIHVGAADGNVLRAWIAGNSNTTGSISGATLDIQDMYGDVMAGFSSRGPNTALDVLKPDYTAPGVNIIAAVNTTNPGDPAEYDFLSGTSMSSPHSAGAGAIVSAAQPGWTPHAVKSAIMMTTDTSNIRKEDAATTADPFDRGAGRIDLSRAIEADLVLDETYANFLAANPATGGDPRTLNLASMQDGTCVGECSFTRTFTNTAGHTVHVDLSASGDANFSVSPSRMKIKGGQTGSFTLTADTRTASGWNFGQVDISRRGDGPDLHMPIAVNAVKSTDAAVFTKTVDQATASDGDLLTYTINITNGQLTGQIDLTDTIPGEVTAVPGSETEVLSGGATISPFSINGNTATWSGTLTPGSISVAPSPSPFGYFPLSFFGIPPEDCPSNCDDGGWVFNVPTFQYNGESYSQVIVSINGTIEAGTSSGIAASASLQKLPSTNPPNNLLAPFWTDLNLNEGGAFRIGVLSAGPFQWTVYDWENVSLFGTGGGVTYSFQVWVQNDSSGSIWFIYNNLDWQGYASIGAENGDGSLGDSYYFSLDGSGTPAVPGVDLLVSSVAGGSATFTFQAEVDACSAGGVITNEAEVSTNDDSERAIAVTTCE